VRLVPASFDVREPITHAAQEFVYCLDGEIDYQVGPQSYRLSAGDNLLFEASHPHCFQNAGDFEATILLVFQAVAGSHVARQRHLDNRSPHETAQIWLPT
jgi:quercetin dioxygenase-like cupin family protein